MQKKFNRSYDSLEQIFEFTESIFTTEEVEQSLRFPVHFVMEELFTNMVKYNTGGGGEISIAITRKDDGLLVELVDYDVDPFDPDGAKGAGIEEPLEERQIGGLGLRLVKSVVERITYEYKHRQMRVSVFKQLEQ